MLGYKGTEHEGHYQIDSTLNNYIRINIQDKLGWDNECSINPEYLTLYDENVEFSYTLTDEFLFFEKADKVIKFKKVNNR